MKVIQIQDVSYEELLQGLDTLIRQHISANLLPASTGLLTRRQLKDKYGLSYSTIHRYVSKGILTPSRIGGKVFFDKKQLEASIAPKIARKDSINQS